MPLNFSVKRIFLLGEVKVNVITYSSIYLKVFYRENSEQSRKPDRGNQFNGIKVLIAFLWVPAYPNLTGLDTKIGSVAYKLVGN